jgi:cytochrome c55X
MASRLAILAVVALAIAAPAAAEDGKRLEHMVQQDCGSCHGLTMKGGLGPSLLPEALAERDDAVLVEAILDGRPGTPMPPWRALLSPADAAWIARQLALGFPDEGQVRR